MRNIFTLFTTLVAGTQVYAQPILQNNMPATGYSTSIGLGSLASEGSAGINQTWDLSAVSLTDVGTISFPAVASTPYAASYPNANSCYLITPTSGPAYYNYNKWSATQLEAYGESISPTTGFNYTPDTKMYFSFPMQYGDSLADTWATATYTGKVRKFYDGYGTLITPYHTYSNVVRIKTIDTNYVGSSATSYVWYTTNPILPVASLDKNTNQLTVLNVLPTEVSNLATTKEISLHLFPSPLTGNGATLSTEGIDNYTNTALLIYNLNGSLVINIHVTAAQQHIMPGKLPGGIYVYELYNNGGVVSKGKISVQ